MENQKILTINNKTEEKFLRKRAADFDFSKFTLKEMRELSDKMRKIMKKANGIGLSANQIGLDFQLFVAEVPQKDSAPKFYTVFNPKLSKPSAKEIIMEEGCLSVPGIWGDVKRPEKITVEGIDKNNKKIKINASGLLARIVQHEADHLNGILFIDKAKNLRQATPSAERESI